MNAASRVAVALGCFGSALLVPLAQAAEESQVALKAEAKVTEQDAKAVALAKVPNGTVQNSTLEKENGRLVWSFDVAQPSTKGVTEVQVDAKSGKVASVKKETPAQEAKEKRGEQQPTK